MKSFINGTIIFLLLVVWGCSQQQHETDPKTPEQNTDLHAYLQSVGSISHVDSLYFITDKYEKKLLHKTTKETVLADFYKIAGLQFYKFSKNAIAMQYFQKAEQLYLGAGDTLTSVKMKGNQAVLLEIAGKYKEAVDVLLHISDYFESRHDTTALAKVFTELGVVYEEMGNADKVIHYNRKALFLRQALHDSLGMATNYNNIGVNYDELLKKPDSAALYYAQAQTIYQRFGHSKRWAIATNNLGRTYLNLNRFDKADHLFKKAYHILDSLHANSEIPNVLRNRGELRFMQGNYPLAIDYFQKARDAYRANGDKKSQLEIAHLLSKVFMATGLYGEAANELQRYNNLKDSIMSMQNQAVIAELETRYQVKEQNKTIKLLKLQDQLHQKKLKIQTLVIVSLVLVFLLLLALFISRHQRLKMHSKQLRLELQNYLLRVNELQNSLKNKSGDCSENKTTLPKLDQFDLSEREKKVLSLIAEGYKNAEIAEELFISQNTVKTHIKNIYLKLDVKNRVEALRKVKE